MSLLTPDDSSSLPRRDFIKLVLAGSGVAAASCHRPGRALAPLLIPEQHLPSGVAYWSRGVCRQCDAGCGVLVKRMEAVVPLTIEGKPFRQPRLVAKKLEGNPDHPLNRGGLCARGQAGLEATYHPLRLAGPLQRAGARGSGTFRPVSWATALTTLRREVTAAPPGDVAWLGRPLHGTEAELTGTWLAGLRGSWWEHRALPAPRATADAERLGRLEDADFVLSFGNFLEGWPAQAATTRAYSRFRRRSRGAFVQVEPRLSLTAANADRWIPVRPGTEGTFALGVAAALLATHPGRLAGHIPTLPAGLNAYTAAAVEAACDIPAGALGETARALATASRPLVVGGPAAYAYPHAALHEQAIGLLAALADTLQGGSGPAGGTASAGASPARTATARRLRGSAGSDALRPAPFQAPLPQPPRVLIVHEANPVFTSPPGWNLAAWLGSIPTIVVLGTLPDETVLQADLVLPLSTPLESWTDDERRSAGGAHILTLNSPAMQPLHDTRSLLDVVAGLTGTGDAAAEGAGDPAAGLFAASAASPAAAAAPAPDSAVALDTTIPAVDERARAALQRRWRTLQAELAPGNDFAAFWAEAVERGGFWAPAGSADAAGSPNGEGAASPAAVPPPASEPETPDYPLRLRVYESPLWGDGAGSWLTWLQELPDPTSSAMWCSWVEVHPTLAARLGLAQGDGVWVESAAGRIELPVFLYPGLRTDTVAIPTGQGHRTGTTATDRGANPFELLVAERDPGTGALAWEATRVRLTPSGRRPPLPLFGRSLQHPVTHR